MRKVICALVVLYVASLASASDKQYGLVKTLPIGGDGGWDYVTVDPTTHHLYVTRSTHTQVIDSDSGKLIADIPDQKRSHGTAIVPDVNRGFISDGGANGGNGAILIFDLKTNQTLGKIESPADSDGIIYDDASKHVLCVCGDESKVVSLAPDVDPKMEKSRLWISVENPNSLPPTDRAKRISISKIRAKSRSLTPRR